MKKENGIGGVDALVLLSLMRRKSAGTKEIGDDIYRMSGDLIILADATIRGKLRRLERWGYAKERVAGEYRGRPRFEYSVTMGGREAVKKVSARVEREGNVARIRDARRGVIRGILRAISEGVLER